MNDRTNVAEPLNGQTSPSTSLHKEVLEQLRDYLVEGNLAEGARIPERALCERFGVSRTPLREALKVLASEGLIELLPNRGARVRRLSEEELRELFDLVGGLESLAGRLACSNISEEEIERIEMIHQEMYLSYIRRDLSEYFKKNQEIHRAIVRAARNTVLSEIYESVTARIRRARYTANLSASFDRWSAAMREHEAILDALRRRAASELSEILFQHLRNKFVAAQQLSGASSNIATQA